MATKIVDATKLDACCAAEADAIRAKTGSAASISYDLDNGKGFSEAIAGISGGDDSVLKALIDRSITSIDIPSGVTTVGSNAFAKCSSLSDVSFPNSVTSIGVGAFNGCTSLERITIPDTVSSISADAFTSCTHLISAVLPNTITTVSANLFRGDTALSEIVIPDSVTSIAAGAFYGCTGLQSITFKKTTPATVANSSAFTNVPTTCEIHVPYSADHSVLNAYKAATNYPDPNTYTYVEDSAT